MNLDGVVWSGNFLNHVSTRGFVSTVLRTDHRPSSSPRTSLFYRYLTILPSLASPATLRCLEILFLMTSRSVCLILARLISSLGHQILRYRLPIMKLPIEVGQLLFCVQCFNVHDELHDALVCLKRLQESLSEVQMVAALTWKTLQSASN